MRSSLETLLTRTWMRRGVMAWLLLPVAVLYRLVTLLHRAWYAWGGGTVGRAPVPLIVVGNVVAGGVGKTPVVMAVVEHLTRRGLAVGIVSRGHGRSRDQVQLVTAQDRAEDVGDEPLLLSRRCAVPVAVARRRMDAVRALLQAHPQTQVIVSDDGLQHHAMWHDMALCVFDDRGLGNGWPLPAGPLREAWPRTPWPGSVQLVLHTGNAPMGGFRSVRQLANEACNARGQTRPLSSWTEQPISALAGIAHPDRFFAMLTQHGLTLRARHALTDHASAQELEAALQQIPAGEPVLCTEKDAVKLWPTHPDVWAVPLRTTLPAALLNQIDGWLTSQLSLPHGQQIA